MYNMKVSCSSDVLIDIIYVYWKVSCYSDVLMYVYYYCHIMYCFIIGSRAGFLIDSNLLVREQNNIELTVACRDGGSSVINLLLSKFVITLIWQNLPLMHSVYIYSKTSDNGHSDKRTTSLQWTNCLPPSINCPYISTSDEGTTSKQWTNYLPPSINCPYISTSDEGTTSKQWTNCLPPSINCPYISTSDEGTTSEQWTKCSSPMCPLFGGSTVWL